MTSVDTTKQLVSSSPTPEPALEIWRDAIAKYEADTEQKLTDPQLGRLKNVSDLERQINERNESFSKFRKRRQKFFEIMRKTMLPVESLGNLAAGGASIAYPPSTLIFGAVTQLVGAAKNVSDNYDSIESLMASLQQFTVRLKVYHSDTISPEMRFQLTQILVTLLHVFALSTKAIQRGRVDLWARSVFNIDDKDIQNAISKLDDLTKNENQLVGAETNVEVKRTHRAVDSLASTLSGWRLEDQKEKQKQHFKNILKPSVVHQSVFRDIKRQHLSGTADWIFQEDIFKAWLDKKLPVIWITGIPGSGKSVLASHIISHLNQIYPQGVNDTTQLSVSYHFFRYDKPDTRTFHEALRNLSYQVVQNDIVYANHIDALDLTPNDIETIDSKWWTLFMDFFVENDTNDSTAFLILDGLDEAFNDEREMFLNLLHDALLHKKGSSRLHVLLTSRPHLSNPIEDILAQAIPTIHISPEKNSDDIRSKARNGVLTTRGLKKVSRDLQEEVIDTLAVQANGMFLWVVLMLNELIGATRSTTIRSILDERPKDLPALFQRVLEQLSATISREEAQDLNNMLSWIATAKRPLSLEDIKALLAFISADGEGIIDLETKLRNQYSSFLVLDREDGLSTADLVEQQASPDKDDDDDDLESEIEFDSDPTTTLITFTHTSIGDFFRNDQRSMYKCDDKPAVGVEINSARLNMFLTMAQYIDKSHPNTADAVSKSLEEHACTYWMSYFEDLEPDKLGIDEKTQVAQLLIQVCRHGPTVRKWAGYTLPAFLEHVKILSLRTLLEDEEVMQRLELADREWVESTRDQPYSMFYRLARAWAKDWFQKPPRRPKILFFGVYAYRQLIQGLPYPRRQLETEAFEDSSIIVETANWVGLEHTSVWHTRLALTLKNLRFYETAIWHFEKGLQIDPQRWGARKFLAATYELQNQHSKALELYDMNVRMAKEQLNQSANPKPGLAHTISTNLYFMGKCAAYLGDHQAQFAHNKEAWQTNPTHFDSIDDHIECLLKQKQWKEIMDTLKDLHDRQSPRNVTALVEYFAQADLPIRVALSATQVAAHGTGEVSFLVDRLKEALDYVRKNGNLVQRTNLELTIANILYCEAIDTKQAVLIWRNITRMPSSKKTDMSERFTRVQKFAYLALAKHHFAKARETQGKEQQSSIEMLEKLGKPSTSVGEAMYTIDSVIILSHWYLMNGQREESRRCVKQLVKQAIQILSDDDPSNDWIGYRWLFLILFYSGECERAAGVFRTMYGRPDTKKSVTKVDVRLLRQNIPRSGIDLDLDDHRSSKSDVHAPWRCNGVCGKRKFKSAEPIWLCKCCFDVYFCSECFALLKEDKLHYNVCSADHDWIKLELIDQSCVPLGHVFTGTGSETMTLDDWKKALKVEWSL